MIEGEILIDRREIEGGGRGRGHGEGVFSVE